MDGLDEVPSDVSEDEQRLTGVTKQRRQRSAGVVFRKCPCSNLFQYVRKDDPGYFPGCDSFCSVACKNNPRLVASATKGRSQSSRAVQEGFRNLQDSYARVGIPTMYAAHVPDPSGGSGRVVVTAKNRDVAALIRYLMMPRHAGEDNVKLTRIMGQVRE